MNVIAGYIGNALESNRKWITMLCYYSIHLLVFTLPLYKKFIPYIIVITLVLTFLVNNFSAKMELMKKRMSYLILFSSLYLIYFLGMAWSSNTSYGWFDLEIKLSLLLFPIVFLGANIISTQNLNRIFKTFVTGCLVATLICFAYAFYRYYTTGDTACFYYSEFSLFHHPGYFSMYLNFAVAILINFIFDKKNTVKITYFILLTIFIITIFQLSSRNGIFSLVAILVYTFIYYIFPRFKWFNSFLSLLIAVGFASFIIYNSSYALERFQNAKEALMGEHAELRNTSAGIRRPIWEGAVRAMNEHPVIGVGTGDVKDRLFQLYEEIKLEKAIELKLNAHNQYIQTGLAVGVLGLVILLLNLSIPFFMSIKRKNIHYGMFIFIVGLNFLTESSLETQSGVVFYAVFNTLLIFTLESKDRILPLED